MNIDNWRNIVCRGDQKNEYLHDTLVLAQVFMAFQKEVIIFAIITLDGQSSGSLLWCDDHELRSKAYYFDQWWSCANKAPQMKSRE